jgi:hypothetical protein
MSVHNGLKKPFEECPRDERYQELIRLAKRIVPDLMKDRYVSRIYVRGDEWMIYLRDLSPSNDFNMRNAGPILEGSGEDLWSIEMPFIDCNDPPEKKEEDYEFYV